MLKRAIGTVLWTLAAALSTTQATATDKAPAASGAARQSPVELDRVVVTARRLEEALRDVPQAITAVTGSELESRGATDISELGMVTPNLTLYPTGVFNGTVTAYIRGIGQFDPISGVEPGIAIYIDDVALARPQGALLDVVDVQRVEVLRGPQGTLYGRNALGGAIKVVTREPGAEFGGKVALTVGNYARRDTRAVLNVPLTDDLRTRLAVASYDRDGYGRNLTNGKDVSARDAGVARFNALWVPMDDVEVRLAYDRYRDRSGMQGARRLTVLFPALDPDRTPPDPGRYDVRSDAAERQDLDNEGASLAVDWSPRPHWRLRSISAWRQGRSDAVLDLDTLARPLWMLDRRFAERQRSQEFQLHYDGDGSHLVTGVYLFDGTESGDVRGTGVQFRPTPFLGTRGSIRTRSSAAYASWVRDLGKGWQFELGLRQTIERKTATALNGIYADASFTTRVSTSADFTDSVTYRAPTPRVALARRLDDSVMLYAQASRGFKGGSYNVRATVIPPESPDPIDAETVTAYEAGVKGDWLDGRLGVQAAVFRNDYQDIQLSVLVPTAPGVPGLADFRNAGSGTTQGAELEWQARLGSVLRWNGHVGYLDARYDRYIDNGVDVASSRRFPNAPRWTAGTSLLAEFPLRDAGSVVARIDGRYQSETRPNTSLNPLLVQKGYSVWNAALAWTLPDRRWELALRANNLADTAYRTSGGSAPAFGLVTGYYGPPRTHWLTLSYAF